MEQKVKLVVYPIRFKPETVEGLREIAAGQGRRPPLAWSQYLRNIAEDLVDSHVRNKLRKLRKAKG